MVTLALPYLDDVYLNGSENEFFTTVTEELDQFLLEKNQKKVLLFPPLSSRLRYITHRITETYDQLSSFSVGEGLTRRTVVCHLDIRILDQGGERENSNRDASRFNNYRHSKYRGGRDGTWVPSGGRDGAPSFRGLSRGRGRRQFNKRPDKALYVPAGLRQKYGTWESDRRVADELELVTDSAGKEVNCDLGVEKHTSEKQRKEGDFHGQVAERSERETKCNEAMDINQTTLEDEQKVADIPVAVGEAMIMETNCKALDMSTAALKGESNVADVRDPTGEMVTMEANCKSLDLSKAALEGESNVADIPEPVDGTVRMEANCRALDLRKSTLEDESKVTDIPQAVGEMVNLEANCNALDLSKAALGDESNMVEIKATGDTMGTEATCNVRGLNKAVSEDERKGVEMADTVSEMEGNCKYTLGTNPTALEDVKMESEILAPVGEILEKAADGETVGVSQAILEVESKAEGKVADLPRPICETVEKKADNDEAMDINQAALEVESKVAGKPDTLCLQNKLATSKDERNLVDGTEIVNKMENEDTCLEHTIMEPLKYSSAEAVQGLEMHNSEVSLFSHKDLHQCPAEGSKELEKTEDHVDENITSQRVVMGEVSFPLPELVNEEKSTVGVVAELHHATSRCPAAASMEALAAKEEEESRVEEDCIQQLLQEIKAHLTEKDISIEKLKFDYSGYGDAQPTKGRFSHMIEIYDFVQELKTEDIMEAFAEFQESEFKLQWVDGTHALGVFSTEEAASQTLEKTHHLLKFRPLSQGTKQSKQKAYQCLGRTAGKCRSHQSGVGDITGSERPKASRGAGAYKKSDTEGREPNIGDKTGHCSHPDSSRS